jgi:hypothetical protein
MSFERMYHAYIVMLHETQIYFGHNAYNKPTKLKLVKTCYVILFTLYSTAGDQSENIHFHTREIVQRNSSFYGCACSTRGF